MMNRGLDKKEFDYDTGMRIEIDPKDTINLVYKTIIHKICGKKHIDREKFATFNHSKHLCEFCDEYFKDDERAIGI